MSNAARSEPQKMPQYARNGGEPLGEPVGDNHPQGEKKPAQQQQPDRTPASPQIKTLFSFHF